MGSRKLGQRKPAAPAVPQSSLYIAFYYEAKDGDTGMENIVVNGLEDLNSLDKIKLAMLEIKKLKPDADHYTNITLLNWWRTEGQIEAPASQPIEPTEIIPPGAQ